MYPEAEVEMMESSALCINKQVTSIQKFAICDWRKCGYLLVSSNFDINVYVHQQSQCLISNQTTRADIQVLGR